MSSPINIPSRIQEVIDRGDYGDELGFGLKTLASEIQDHLPSSPDSDEARQFLRSLNPYTLNLCNQLFVCGTGWTPESIIDISEETWDGDISRFINDTIQDDSECPFGQTTIAIQGYNSNKNDIEIERQAANDVFKFFFDASAEEILNSVVSDITREYKTKAKQQPETPSP